jgi:glyoxylase-like metal-dependent hydrolase (beta-lactamase superfamily II)
MVDDGSRFGFTSGPGGRTAAAKQVVPGLFVIPTGVVNTFLLDAADGCALIDAGLPDRVDDILRGIAAAGKRPADVRHLIVTHAHPDHIGSLAAVRAATGAAVYCHPADAAIVTAGGGFRPLSASPGVVSWLVWRLFILPMLHCYPHVAPTPVDHHLFDGQVLPIAGGLTVVHAPGHCAGQVALLWAAHGGVLLAADAASHAVGLRPSPAYEDWAVGEQSLRRLSALDFQVACFGHGKAIVGEAAARFRRHWPVARALDSELVQVRKEVPHG